jgi:hypothetical protein
VQCTSAMSVSSVALLSASKDVGESRAWYSESWTSVTSSLYQRTGAGWTVLRATLIAYRGQELISSSGPQQMFSSHRSRRATMVLLRSSAGSAATSVAVEQDQKLTVVD